MSHAMLQECDREEQNGMQVCHCSIVHVSVLYVAQGFTICAYG